MKRPRSHVVGELAEGQLAEALKQLGNCTVQKVGADNGEDLIVEVPVNGDLHGVRVLLQVKGG